MHRRAFGRLTGAAAAKPTRPHWGTPHPFGAFGHGGRVVFAEKDIETESVCVYVFTGDVGLLKF